MSVPKVFDINIPVAADADDEQGMVSCKSIAGEGVFFKSAHFNL